MQRRTWLSGGLAWLATAANAPSAQAQAQPTRAASAVSAEWARIERTAHGQTVYFSAWAGSDRVNAHVQWAGTELRSRFGIELQHVGIDDASEVVRRLRAERAAGRIGGSIDLAWINGAQFVALKREHLLYGPIAPALPNYGLIDLAGTPGARLDAAEPVEGMEVPWGATQLTFFAERNRLGEQPRSAAELLAWAQANPGQFTYPRPPQAVGVLFLKQLLSETIAEREHLMQPPPLGRFAPETAPLWDYLDRLHRVQWAQGKRFAPDHGTLARMLADGQLTIALTNNPGDVVREILAQSLPRTVFSYQHAGGTVGSVHCLAVPLNAGSKEAAQVAINFLLSPLAQARKADLGRWGDATVLAVPRLSAEQQGWFSALKGAGSVAEPAPVLPEPHPSWVDAMLMEWAQRYGA